MYPLTRRIIAAAFGLLTAFLVHASGATLPQDDIVVAEGTAVKVLTTSEITSKKAKPNDPVGFTVDEDVVMGRVKSTSFESVLKRACSRVTARSHSTTLSVR